MIQPIFDTGEIRKYDDRQWIVVLPQNGAILAYCTTEDEAKTVLKRLKNSASMLRRLSGNGP